MAAPSTQRRPLTSLISKRNANSPQKVQFLENSESKNSSKLIVGTVSAVKFKNKFKRAASAINLKRNQISVFDESKSIIPSIVMNDEDSQKKEENIGLEEKIKMINQRYKELHLDLDPVIAKTLEEEKEFYAEFFEGTLDNGKHFYHFLSSK